MTGRLVIYNDEMHLDLETGAELMVGDELEVIRGNGPREGDRMGTAVVTAVNGDGDATLEVRP